jgi:hypothetical protein
MAKDFVLGHGSTSPFKGEVTRGHVDACMPSLLQSASARDRSAHPASSQ